jgi:uncharacterized protein YhfF
MAPSPLILNYWQSYRASLPAESRPDDTLPPAWFFCDNQADADELGALVADGIKTATCSLFWLYETENEHLPQVGDLSIITNWAGEPLAIIQTTEVTIRPYDQVDAQFAYDEGEGDRSLRYWRDAHWRFFSRECAQIGRQAVLDMPVVCERFRLVYR